MGSTRSAATARLSRNTGELRMTIASCVDSRHRNRSGATSRASVQRQISIRSSTVVDGGGWQQRLHG
ncbi:hypothetical protein NL676_029619 [Syzygium grande]|nr:hypothetical protein NL676_029619 [Syzygium grande]